MTLRTVDNKLWPDRLAGQIALDPKHYRQQTFYCMTEHGNEFWAKASPLLILVAVITTFNVISYDVVWAESNPSSPKR